MTRADIIDLGIPAALVVLALVKVLSVVYY